MKLEDIKREIVKGRKLNVAISIDTSIFDGNGLRLRSGLLRHLEQFSKHPGTLLISDVVESEIHKHLAAKMIEAQKNLKGALSSIEDYWEIQVAKFASLEVQNVQTIEAEAASRLGAFLSRCKAVVLKAEGMVSLDRLMADYFAARAPFEPSGSKKNEFPDAVALLTLEAWSRQTGRFVLLVSADKGWKAFAEQSDRLCCIESLEAALGMFQRRDTLQAELLPKLVAFLGRGRWSGLDDLADPIADLNWEVEAASWHNFEVVSQVAVTRVTFANDDIAKCLHPVDLSDDQLTVAVNLLATVNVDADFSFELEGVSLGGASVSKKVTRGVTALLTFDKLNTFEPELREADFPRRPLILDLGQVEPDYSGEDPGHEQY